MRILMVTDLHYRPAHHEWLVGRAGDVDIVAVTGDLAGVWKEMGAARLE